MAKNSFVKTARRLLGIALACNLSATAWAISVNDLRCEMLRNPWGVDNTTPSLSWKIPMGEEGLRQTAYQIIAASTPEQLTEKDADLWKSGKVNSTEQVWVKYAGKKLDSRSTVYWKVRVWDGKDKASGWSETAHFSVGLLNDADWQGQYIGASNTDKAPSPILRKKFNAKKGDAAFIQISTLGYHEVYLNGRRVSDDALVPAVSEYKKRALSMSYDVQNLLKDGENDLVILLGRGWYDGKVNGTVAGGPYVKAQLDIRKNGRWQTAVKTDNTWQWRKSGYYTTGQWAVSSFGGEDVDANEIPDDFKTETLDALQWQNVVVGNVPKLLVTPMTCEPNRIKAELHPVSITRYDNDVWLIDMGKSVSGWTKFDFGKLNKNQNITISYCDMLKQDGNFEVGVFTDHYKANGKGNEQFCNKFNYHAYRYIKLQGLGRMPQSDEITAYSIYTDYATKSGFSCDNEDINRIHEMIHYTFPCLSTSGYLVDCPQLERKGYGGDGNASTPSFQMMYDVYPLYTNWLRAYADAQGDDGDVPHIGPNPSACGGGPFWCVFIATAPWQTYVQYGDKSVLEKYYPNMQLFQKFAEKYMPDGLLTLEHRWPNNSLHHWFLGDWALPNEDRQLDTESIDLVSSCSMSWFYDTMRKIANVLGKTDDAKAYEKKHRDINEKIQKTFFHASTGTYGTGLQLDQAFPLFVGATPQDQVDQIQKNLRELTRRDFDNHFFTGLVGIPVITWWLTQYGDAQLFYTMLSQHSYPGYLYMIDNGATTTWEHWEATRSRIHNCYNGIGSWFYQALGGIVPDEAAPGYRHFFIKPQPVDGISNVRVSKNTPYGNISIDWHKDANKFDIKIEVPVGTTATLSLPFRVTKAESPQTALVRYGIVYNEKQKGMQTPAPKVYEPNKPIELDHSGKYRFIFTLEK